MKISHLLLIVIGLTLPCSSSAEKIVPPESGDLIDFKIAPDKRLLKGKKVTIKSLEQDGVYSLSVSYGTDNARPGITIPAPKDQEWDLTGFGKVAVEIFNPGPSILHLSLQLHNAASDSGGDKYNTSPPETILPEETKEISVPFEKVRRVSKGTELDPSKIDSIHVFDEKPQEPGTFVIKSIKAIP